MIVRASDVPTYVQHGAADIGVAGKDVLLEHGGEGLYQPLDLEIARCRMVVATKRGFDWAGTVQRGARIRVATKYVQTAREHFAAKGMHVDLIKLYGSMELAPLSGLADAIVDLVSSGQHAQGERSRRRRGHRADQRAARRQSGRAQVQARASCSRCSTRWRRRSRRGGARRMSDDRRVALRSRRAASMRRRRASSASSRRSSRSRRRRTPRWTRRSRGSSPTCGARRRGACSNTRRRFDRVAAASVRGARNRRGRDARRPSRRCRTRMREALRDGRRAHPRLSRAAEARVLVVPRCRRQRVRPAGDAARPRRRLRAGRQGRVSVVGADERDSGARRRRCARS